MLEGTQTPGRRQDPARPCPYPCAPLTSHCAQGAFPTYLPGAARQPGQSPTCHSPSADPEKPHPTQTAARSEQAARNAIISSSVQSSPGFYLCTHYSEASCRSQLTPALRSIPAWPPLRCHPHLNGGRFLFCGARGDVGRSPHPMASSPVRAPAGAGEEGRRTRGRRGRH